MSARSSWAPAPISTAKRARAILVARSKSMMPSFGPRSQCASGLEVEGPRLTPGADHDVVGGALSDRHRGVRDVGQPGHQPVALVLDALQFDLELLDLLAAELVGLEDRLGVEPLALGAGHLVGGGVLLAFQPLELRNQPAAMRLEAGQLFELGRHLEAAVDVAGTDGLEVVAYVGGIKHAAPLSCVSYYG